MRKNRWIACLAAMAVLISSLIIVPIHVTADSDRNLLSNEDGSANAGLYGGWLTKYTFAAADVSDAVVDLTADAFTACARDWSLEKPGKAVDGVVNAISLNEAFLAEPADVSGKSPVGVLIDLQKNCSVSSLKVYMAYTVGGLRRVIGRVYAGTTPETLSLVSNFNSWDGKDVNPPVNVALTGTARYVFVAFTSYNALATVSGRATGLPLDEIQVYGSVPRYTVTFDANGGLAAESSRSVESGSALGTLPTATLSGKELAGWVKEDGTIVTSDTMVTGAMTLKALWYRNLLCDENGTVNPGVYGSRLTKYTFEAAAVSGNSVDLTAAAFTAHEREWSLEKPGKAVDGVVNAPSLNEAFLVEPADVPAKSPVGVLIDLEKDCALSALKVYMAYTVGGLRRVIGSVYTGTDLNNLSKVQNFNNYNTQDANPAVQAQLSGIARYVFVAFTSYNALAAVSGRATGLPLDEIQVIGSTPSYTVTFDANGGTVAEEHRSVPGGSALGTLPAADFSGKSFAGWVLEDGTAVTPDTVVNCPMTLKAVWHRNLLCNEDGTVNPGVYGGWLTKYTFDAADVSGIAVNLTAAAFTAHEREWSLEKPGKAVDGVVNAPSLNEAFLVEPADVSDKSPVGVLIDLQKVCPVSSLKVYMAYTVGGYRRVVGRVYAGSSLNAFSLVKDFNNYNNQDANPAVSTALTGTARYIFVVFTSYNALATASGRATGLPLDEIQVFGTAPDGYTVTFDYGQADGGTDEFSRKVSGVLPIGRLPMPTCTGSVFSGWYTDAGEEITADYVAGDSLTIHARFGVNLLASKEAVKLVADSAALPAYVTTSFTADEKCFKATDGIYTADYGYSSGNLLKLTKETDKDTVGLLFDLGAVYELDKVILSLCPDSEVEGTWKTNLRDAAGVVYAGMSANKLAKIGTFDNAAALQARIGVNGASALGRYVAVFFTRCNTISGMTNTAYLYEIEALGHAPVPETVSYTITFASGEGATCSESSRLVQGKTPVGALPVAAKEGLVFAGWYDEAGEEVAADTLVTGNGTLTARFCVNLTADRQGIKVGANGNTLPAFAEKSWATDEYFMKITDGDTQGSGSYLDSSLLRLKKADGYDAVGVMYDLGAIYALDKMVLSVCPDEEVAIKEWKRGLRNVAGVIYAGQRKSDMKAVASFDNAASLSATVSPELSGVSGRYVMVLFTRNNTISGFTETAYLYELQLLGNRKIPTANERSVTFAYGEDVFSGNEEEERLVLTGEKAGVLPVPVRIGYSFGGWYTNLNDPASVVTGDTVITDSITLHARWTQQENLLAGKLGVKVLAPKGKPGEFVVTRYKGNEFADRATDGNRRGNWLGLDVSFAYDCMAGMLYDLGDIYDLDSFATFQDFTGWNLTRTIRGMKVYAGNSFYDLCDDKNLVFSTEDNGSLMMYKDLSGSVSARFVVFFFTDPTTDPEALNAAETGQRYHDSGSVAHIHELEVYGTKSSNLPEATVQNGILGQEPTVQVAASGKLNELEDVVFATGLSSYMTLDYSRLNEMDSQRKRQYTMGYSYTFTNVFPGDKVVYTFDLGETTTLHKVKCGYFWGNEDGKQTAWDVYVSTDRDTLLSESNRTVGRIGTDPNSFVLDMAREGRYVAFVITAFDTTAYVSSLEVYAGERLPSYNVYFDYQGATSALTENKRVVSAGKKIGTLPTPRKTDLQFLGWYADKEFTLSVDSSYVVNGSVTLYARWGSRIVETRYVYALEDYSTGLRAEIILNSATDVLPTFAKLSVAPRPELQDGLYAALKSSYHVYDIYAVSLVNMRGDAVDIEGRMITVYIPVPAGKDGNALSVVLKDGEGIYLVPAKFADGCLVFDTYHLGTYAVVEGNYTVHENELPQAPGTQSPVIIPEYSSGAAKDELATEPDGTVQPAEDSGSTTVVRKKVVVKKTVSGFNPWWIIVPVILLVVAGGVVLSILLAKRRKRVK